MTQRGSQGPGPDKDFYQVLNGPGFSSPVFPGKPYPGVEGNLAVQRSLMEIFDEFTDVISGELKSMTLEDLENPSGTE